MKPQSIFFFNEGIVFRLLNKEKLTKWITKMTKKERHEIANINYIFCNDKYLRSINKKYLNHDYFTDIVTFDNSSEKKTIEGDASIHQLY